MAERRMFAKTIVTSDAFLDMPATTRSLYMLLCVMADDDGFVNAPRSIMRQSGATDDDMKLLIVKRFVLTFESGIVVIKHWRIHNLIQKDRYKETKYLEEKATLALDENNAYTEAVSSVYPECIQPVSKPEPQVRLGKVSTGKSSLGEDIIEGVAVTGKPNTTKRFTPPTVDQVKAYCEERRNWVDPQRFVDHYTSNGWMVGKNKMKDWKAAVRTWEKNGKDAPQKHSRKGGNVFLEIAQEEGIV